MTQRVATRRLGRTSLTLPELGFGAGPMGNLYRPVTDEDARATLAKALAEGLHYIDTAPYYGFGLSERRVGDALRGREDVIVSTKAGRLLRPMRLRAGGERDGFHSPLPFTPVFDYSYDGVLRSCDDSLQRLGLSRIDILLAHDIGAETHGSGHGMRLDELRAGGLRAMQRLKDEGVIAAFGIGVNEIAVCLDLLADSPLDLILLAGRYTLLEQGALDALFPRCRETGTAIVVGGPYNSGILATDSIVTGGRYNYARAPAEVIERVRRIEAVCVRHGVGLGTAALHFVLAHPQVASVIPGMASAAEVEATVARYRTGVPSALWEELRHERLIRADAGGS